MNFQFLLVIPKIKQHSIRLILGVFNLILTALSLRSDEDKTTPQGEKFEGVLVLIHS